MDINDFKTFLEIRRTRHFGRAAENLCVTQSTVSARIRHFEEQIGARLFVRERNNIQLTPAGERLTEYAELIVASWERAVQEIGSQDDSRQTLVVGGMPSLWDITLQEWLQRLYKERHNLIIHAEVHHSEALQRRVLNGSMDLAFVFDKVSHNDLVTTAIDDIELILVSSQAECTVTDAVTKDYILVDWGVSFFSQHAEQFAGITAPILHVGQGRIALNYILSNGGNAYLAAPMVHEALASGMLFHVKNSPTFTRKTYAIHSPHGRRQDLISLLLNTVVYSSA